MLLRRLVRLSACPGIRGMATGLGFEALSSSGIDLSGKVYCVTGTLPCFLRMVFRFALD